MVTKENFYIITGGPGGGKTTLLENLSSKGYSFVPETARQIIKNRLSRGLTPRPEPLIFATGIFEKDLANFMLNTHCSSTLFFDRSLLDSACQIFNCDKNYYDKIKAVTETHRYNNKVFITPPWEEIYQTDTERDQTFKQAVEVYEMLYQWYVQHNYEVLVLPNDSVENRAAFVLNNLNS